MFVLPWFLSLKPCEPHFPLLLRLGQWRTLQRRKGLWQVRVEGLKRKRLPGTVFYMLLLLQADQIELHMIWDLCSHSTQ